MDEVERLRREILELIALRDRALEVARTAIEHRLAGMNEFRASLDDQSRTFMPRSEIQLLIDRLGDRVAENERFRNNLLGRMAIISFGVPVVVSVVVTVLVRVFLK